jgi:hypothetical protein
MKPHDGSWTSNNKLLIDDLVSSPPYAKLQSALLSLLDDARSFSQTPASKCLQSHNQKKSHNTTQTKQTPILIFIGYIICNNVENFKKLVFSKNKALWREIKDL